MFGAKEKKTLPESTITVSTIPDEFYGGKNPVVSFKNISVKVKGAEKPTGPEKKAFYEQSVKSKHKFAEVATNPKYLALFAGIIFVLALLSAGGYYYIKNTFFNKQMQIVDTSQENIVPSFSDQSITPQENLAEEKGEEQAGLAETATTTVEETIKELSIDFPSILLAESADLDNDGLTDLAEEEFGTDPGDFDTDKDKYPDGLEVHYLYNPKGFEPQKLVDSGLVKTFENPNFNYRVYIPVRWAVGSVDEENRQVLFSTLSGENFEIRVFDLQSGEDFDNWFVRMALSQDFSNLDDFETRAKYIGKMRKDGLVYYFTKDNRVYVMLYHTTDSTVVNYKAVFSMMARSLDFEVSQKEVLEQQTPLINPPAQIEEEATEEIEEIETF